MQVSRICSDLVRIRSENPPGATADAIEYIRNFLEGLGIRSEILSAEAGAENLVAGNRNAGILFCGHLDVVPALDEGWTHPPFSGLVDDKYVWGRGSTDMKGGCAAILSACETMADSGNEIPASLAFVCDEETGGELGIRHVLAQDLLHPCDCLVAEPTPARHPTIGQKGLCRLELRFSGVPGHGSLYPAVGVSAIAEALSLVGYMKELSSVEYPVDADLREIIEASGSVLGEELRMDGVGDVLRKLTYNPGTIRGGEKANVVAQRCDLELECRVPWGCNISDLIGQIRAHSPRATILSQDVHAPSMTDPKSPIVAIVCSEIGKVQGGPVFPIVQWAASDARHLRRQGFRVVEYGPGEIGLLHAVDERVRTESLARAARIYRGIMEKYAAN